MHARGQALWGQAQVPAVRWAQVRADLEVLDLDREALGLDQAALVAPALDAEPDLCERGAASGRSPLGRSAAFASPQGRVNLCGAGRNRIPR